MNADDTYGVEPLSEEPCLPKPYEGGYERVTNLRTGDCETALYVFERLQSGQKAYLGTFFGSFTQQAYEAFQKWLRVYRDHNLNW